MLYFTFSQSSTVFLTPVLYLGGVVLDVEEVWLPQHRHQADGEQQVQAERERRPQGALFGEKKQEQTPCSKGLRRDSTKVLVVPQSSNRVGVLKNVKKDFEGQR